MSRDQDVLDYFQENFGEIVDAEEPNADDLATHPEFLQEFWKRFGMGSRSDGFVWLLDPAQSGWINELFGLDQALIPFSRTSFGDLHFVHPDGSGYYFSPSYKDLQQMSTSFHSTVMSLADPSYVDDDALYERHQALWEAGERVEADTCFCLNPAIPLGGDEESSEVYVGEYRAYLTLLSQM